MSNRSSVCWSFDRHTDNVETTWLWQRFGPGGRVEKTSEPHATYGMAMWAAIQNGFRPDRDDYSLDLPSGRMHFPPGRNPEFVSSRLPSPEARPPYAKALSPIAWALLGFLHRADHGGPSPPALKGLQNGYNELLALNLATHAAKRMKITNEGEAALRDRYLSDG
jgi:hypothetical protein